MHKPASSLVVCEHVLGSLRRQLKIVIAMQPSRYYLSVRPLLQMPWYDRLPMSSNFPYAGTLPRPIFSCRRTRTS